jgi:hypothetical protein
MMNLKSDLLEGCSEIHTDIYIYWVKKRREDDIRIPRFVDSPLTDGVEVVSLTRRLAFAPQEDSWYSILLEDESTARLSAAGRIK